MFLLVLLSKLDLRSPVAVLDKESDTQLRGICFWGVARDELIAQQNKNSTRILKPTTMSYGVSKRSSKDRRSNKHQMGELHDS